MIYRPFIALAVAGVLLMPGVGTNAADPPATEEKPAPEAGSGAQEIDVEALKEQMRKIGEIIREAIQSATQEAADPGNGGLGGLAPKSAEHNVRAIYGPDGPTVRSVKALLEYRLVLLGNPRLKAGPVHEKDGWIVAEVVTTKEEALVARYLVNKTTGAWVPQR
ncbi:MAG: hypothetical protein AB7P12_15445 [Alphaproteobacteria bacterium]